MSDRWRPAQYNRFADERRQPFVHLLAGIAPRPGGAALDIGCGPGALTVELHRAKELGRTLGIDSSDAMLEVAERDHADAAGVSFAFGDITDWDDEGRAPFDIVCSNAALHWVDDQQALMPALFELVAPGGQLAFQVPRNEDHPSHAVAAELATTAPFRAALDGFVRTSPVLEPRRYAELFHAMGAADIRVEERIFGHLLPDVEAVVQWVRGSLLTAYSARMPFPLYEHFEAAYARRLAAQLGDAAPYYYTYRRLFVWVTKPSRAPA